MNKQCFRLVFNQHRGRQVAVSELASSEQSRGSVARRQSSRAPFRFQRLSPLMVGLSLVFPTLSWSYNIVADKQAPGTQQAIVLKAANGVPLINIQTPNDKGVSINQFSHLDVDRQGAIFNNSQRAVQTQLGGWVQSNPWVLGKEAKLIVNQVNSRDPSYLQGFIEVAGRPADMVIANPAGIQVDGAGFINIPQITLTTGLPQYQNGALTGFAVREGQISVLGEGLDATRTNATRLFAKALELRAGIFAQQLDAVMGSNDLSPEGQAKATAPTQSQAIAIDTKAIGGMYAQSIYLLVTDKGAGVNNGGQWFAGSGGLTLDSEGNLTNSGSIVVADKSTSSMDQSTLTIKTDTINNTGSLSGEGRTQINTRTLNNDGLVASTSELVLHPTETLQNTGNINASRLDIQTQTLINTQGQIVQTGSMALSVDVGHLSQSQGSYLGGLALSSHQDSGSSTGSDSNSGIDPSVPASNETGLTITLPPSTAQGGGDTPVVSSASATLGNALPEGVIKVQDRLSNTDGKIVANAKTRVTSHARLKNEASSLLVDQLEVKSEGLTNRNGTIEASQVTIKGDDVINDKGRLSVEGNLTANITQTFNNTGRIETQGNLIVTDDGAQTLTLTNTGEVFSVHNILLQGKTFTNSGALAADHDIQFQGISFRNTGTVKAVHALDVNLVDDYRVKVPLQAGHDLTLKTQGNVYAYSTLEAGHDVNVDTHRMKVEADGQVTAGNNAQLHVTNGLSNRGLINSQGLTAISTGTQVYNGGTGRIYGNHVAIKTTDLMNREETVDGRTTAASIVARDRLDIAAQKVVNREHSLIASEGSLYIGRYMNAAHWASGQAEKVENGSATIESGGDMTIEAKRLRNLNLHFKSEVKEVPGSRKEHVQDYLRDEENDMTYYTRNDITDTGKRGVIYFKGRRTEDYWLMDYTYYETQPYVVESDPAIIRSGGHLTLKTDEAINNKSHILANDNITVEGATVTNIDATGEHREIRKGRRNYHYIHYKRGRKKGKWTGWESYRRADVVTPIALDVFQYRPHDSTQVTVAGAPAPTIENLEVNGQAVRRVSTITNLPNQSLYRINKDNPNAPLLETDPAYTHYRQWLGSYYMLRALGQDPALMHKRLGDGYVEQRLVREQIAQLTGRVRLEGYATEEAQFQALLDAGITFAERFHLTPGVSLSPEMLAQLTSDIVWLEDETVKLPDGTTETVLVPKVYVVVRPGDLDGSGSLIAADTLQLNLSRQLENQGTLAGRRVMQINADTIQNLGRIEGGEVALRTKGDLVNLGGTIHGKDRVALQAGRDLRSHSSLYHTSNKDDVNTTSRTDILRVAGIYATNPNAQVLLDAARDVELKASQVGSEGQVVIRAGRDVRLGSLTTNVDERSVVDEWNQIQRRRTSDVGSNVTAKGDVDIVSARETSLHASVLKADGDVKINAGKAVRVEAGKSEAYDKVASTQKDSGLLSSSEKHHRYEVETTNSLSSVINGKAVSIASGGDVNVVGSRVISEDRTDIDAAGAINIKASENTRIENEARYEKKSGLTASLSRGVASIGNGRQTLNATATREASSLTQSEVGSLKGDATLVANQAVTVKGSTIATGRDLTVRGSDIHVENGEATHQESSSVKTTQSGFSLGVTYNRQAAMKGAIEKQWKDDAATHLGWVGQSVKTGYAYAEGVMASHTPVVITLGQQKHRAQHQTEGQEVVKSELGANGALQLIAHEGDIRIVGSRVRAEGEATLAAKENLHVEAAHQRQSENASSKRSGFSLDDRNWVAPVGSFNDQRKEGAQIDQAIGSELSFGEKAQLLTEKGDIHVEGSSIVAANDLTLQSGRDVVIKSATSTQSSRAEQSSRGIGAVQISDTERFVGYIASKQENDGVSSTLNRSQVGSLTGNVTIDAKGDYRQKVADIGAGKDINITANTITVEADHQTHSQDSSASDSKVGVFAKVSSPLIDLAQVTETAVKSKADDRTKALQTLATGAQGYITYDSVSKGNIAKGEVGLGVRSSKQNSESELRISQGNLLRADGNVRLTTREGDVALTHTTVEAGGNVHIDSARDIVLKAGETTQTAKGSNKNAGVGVGVGVSVGAQTGVYGYVEASLGSGKQNLEAKTYEITTVQGKQVDLKSARDTTIKGAQVHGDRVDVHTGGNLTIESLQDHVEQKISQSGMGARVQVSLGTAWDASGNVSQSKAKGKTDTVNQQSGLFAGQGGYHINAEKVTLVGGAIVSTATEENNELSTNRLDFKDLENHSEYDAYSASMAASYGDKNKTTTGKSTGIDQSGQFNMLPTLPVREQGEDQSTTYATISPGKITVNGELVDLKTLGIHTDASTAHRSVSALPDLAALQAKQQQISQTVSTIAQAAETYRQNQWLAAENAKAKARAEAEERLKQQGVEAWSAYQALSENDKTLQLEMTDASYRQAMIEASRWGIGGDKARLTQATTTLVTSVLAGQSVSQVTVNTVAPYASKLVGDAFAHGEDPEPLKQAMGHFVVGAAMAYVNGANPLAGGSAAVAAEKASAVLAEMYNDGVTAINEKGEFDPALLPEEAKREITSLTGAIAGIAMATGDGGTVLNAQIGRVIGKNASDNNNLRLFISLGRITYKVYRYYKKVGKLRSVDIAQMVIDEGLSLAENIDTLVDGEWNVNDALAIVDLLTGLVPKQVSIIRYVKPVTNEEVNEISRALKNYYKLRKEITLARDNGRTATFSKSILTNKERRDVARILKYRKTGEVNNKGEEIWENTKRYPKYISFSKSSHNGDFLKGYDSIKDAKLGLRNGSYDEFLNRVKK